MKKKIALITVMIMVFMSIAQSVGAINVIMNSSFLPFPDQEPVVQNGTTLVPIRAVAEALGLEVGWDDPTDTVTLKKDNFYIELVIGSTTAKTSSGTKTLLTAPCIINSRTMVPLRFIAEEMGLTVSWNQEYQRVVIAGEVDTQTVPVPPVEETTDAASDATEPVEDGTDVVIQDSEPVEEETEFIEEVAELTFIDAQSSSISFEMPVTYLPEDTDSEESFAYRSLDAFDAQHTYNWEIVSTYESYADGTSGILFIVQDLGPYEGEVYDVARAMDEYPDAPEAVEIDFGYIMSEVERLIMEQMCAEMEVEIPEGYEEMEDEELATHLGFESAEAMDEYMSVLVEEFDMYQIPEYADYMNYREEYNTYRADVDEINNAKNYAIRMFSEVKGEFDDETWAQLFTNHLNADDEVRYEGVEVIDFDGKKLIHATIYAEDPDDEQGVYDYYEYRDGDSVVTIFGGTLFGGEPAPEAVEALSGITVN